jgi:hypothetical protein
MSDCDSIAHFAINIGLFIHFLNNSYSYHYLLCAMWVVASATRLGGKLRANPTSAAPGCPPVRL